VLIIGRSAVLHPKTSFSVKLNSKHRWLAEMVHTAALWQAGNIYSALAGIVSFLLFLTLPAR